MTKFFKGKRQAKALPPPVPRVEDEIRKEYADVAFAAGQAQYQVYVYTEELSRINQRLLEINQEAAARQKLNKDEAEAAKPAETGEVK
jgi:hypothetical protein